MTKGLLSVATAGDRWNVENRKFWSWGQTKNLR